MEPLRFQPILKSALWGGQRLCAQLGKQGAADSTTGESWEVSDLPGSESIVHGGPLDGTSVRELMQDHPVELLGRHGDLERFPLLVKFIDAEQRLSLQVHPGQEAGPDAAGKAEVWIVMHVEPGSRLDLGLKSGVTRDDLLAALADGGVEDLLHSYTPQPGDCIYVQPGTVHAIGSGIMIAEIQQTSDTTYRLYDWGRVDHTGRPRMLHLDEALEATDFTLGPVRPRTPTLLDDGTEELINNGYFIVHRRTGAGTFELLADDRAHVLTLLSGAAGVVSPAFPIDAGETVVIPADRGPTMLRLEEGAILLDAFLPDDPTVSSLVRHGAATTAAVPRG